MQLKVQTHYIRYHVDEQDSNRIQNAEKELINKHTFSYGFEPQLPNQCLRMIQNQVYGKNIYMMQEGDNVSIAVPVPIRPFHMNQFISVEELNNFKVEESESEKDLNLPPNMEFLTFSIKQKQFTEGKRQKRVQKPQQ